jgi:transcriptional regulator with XRE-family HTH domain
VEFHTYLATVFVTVKGVNNPRNIVGPVVRELREKTGLTQTALATKLNLAGWDVSRDIIARIEGQVRWVADFEVAKLAASLGIDGPELLRRGERRVVIRPSSRQG